MQIEDFEDSPSHLMVVVHDGDRQAVVVLEKGTGKVVCAEAVGGKTAVDCLSFADEAAAWPDCRVKAQAPHRQPRGLTRPAP